LTPYLSDREFINMEHELQPPAEVTKTGTTTVGLIAKDCVVLASDQRATMGFLIASKTAQKIHKITDRIGVTIAGSVADAQNIVGQANPREGSDSSS
jgi:20S proteasome alpha/beta subunit